MFTYKPLNENKVLKSNVINTAFREIFNDISDLHEKSVTANINQAMLLDVVNSYTDAINNLIDTIQQNISNIDSTYTIYTLYSTAGIIYPTATVPYVNHEPAFGRATLKVFSRKLLFANLDSAGTYRAIPNIADYLNWYSTDHMSSDAFDRVLENEVEKAFDQDPNTIFYRRLETTDESQTSADLVMEMSIPAYGDSVNSLRIHPFPESAINIESITYSTQANETNYFVDREGFDITGPFTNTRKLALSFQSVKPSVISIKLKQNNKSGLDPYYFMAGFHNISVANELYENVSYIGFEIDRPVGKSTLNRLVTNLMDNGTIDLDTGASYYIFTDIDAFNTIDLDAAIYNSDNGIRVSPGLNSVSIPEGVDVIYVLVKLIKDINENTPIFKNISVEWDT